MKTINDFLVKDKSFQYKGYSCKLKRNINTTHESYYCAIYKGDKYIAGIRGPVNIEKAIEFAKLQ